MFEVDFTCVKCGEIFARKLGSFKPRFPPRYCSLKCVGAARSAGELPARRKTSIPRTCEICGSAFRAKKERPNRRFCKEACRLEAFRRGIKRADVGVVKPWMRTGEEITCCICGDTVYRKASLINRNVSMTCGKRKCISAYGRSMWGLAPREIVVPRKKRQRTIVFTATQRKAWLGTKCIRCGATENLALDHIIPVCAGGQSVLDNAQTLCQPCNNWKAKHVDRPLARKHAQSGG